MSGYNDKGSWAEKFFEKTALKKKVSAWKKDATSSSKGGDDGGKSTPSHISFTVMTRDLAATFGALNLQHIVIPTPLIAEVTLDITGDGADQIMTDATLLPLIQRLASQRIDAFAKEMGALLKIADPAATDASKQDFVKKTLLRQVEVLEVKAGEQLKVAIETADAYLKRDKERLKKWKIKCGLSIGLGSFVIVGSAVVTGLTWGAAAPAAVVAIARSCVQLAHTIADLAMTLDQTGGMVKGQLLVLQKLMETQEADQSDKDFAASKKKNSAMNVGLGVASGLLGAKSIPTIKNCEGYIETYGMKITELEVEREKISANIYKMMDAVSAVERQAKSLPDGSDARKLADKFVEAAQGELQQLLEHTEEVIAGILKGYDHRKKWTEALEELQVHGWTNHVATVTGAITDLGLGAGGAAPDGLMAGLAILTSLEATCADQIIDKS